MIYRDERLNYASHPEGKVCFALWIQTHNLHRILCDRLNIQPITIHNYIYHQAIPLLALVEISIALWHIYLSHNSDDHFNRKIGCEHLEVS